MSTNFYWNVMNPVEKVAFLADAGFEIVKEVELDWDDPNIHISTRVGISNGQTKMIWAQPKDEVIERLGKLRETKPDVSVIVDECGDVYKPEKAFNLLNFTDRDDFDMIGEVFA